MRKVILYFILLFQIVLIASLVRGVYESFKSRERIAQLVARKEVLETKKGELEQKMEEVQSPLYLETVARDELHLSKPGETVVIIPEGINIEAENMEQAGKEGEKTNWQKWFLVVSGKMD